MRRLLLYKNIIFCRYDINLPTHSLNEYVERYIPVSFLDTNLPIYQLPDEGVIQHFNEVLKMNISQIDPIMFDLVELSFPGEILRLVLPSVRIYLITILYILLYFYFT